MKFRRLLFFCLGIFLSFPGLSQIFGGIGAQLYLDTTAGFSLPRISNRFPGSPAADSLQDSLYVLMVEDHNCRNQSIEQIVSWIRGGVGSAVTLTVGKSRNGSDFRTVKLIRVAIQGATQDPNASFYSTCENETIRLKKSGAKILKTYRSECGNFYFNFDAGEAPCHIVILAHATTDAGLKARIFDSDHEDKAITLEKPATTNGMQRLEGTVTYQRNSIGVINTSISAPSACQAMYILIYK